MSRVHENGGPASPRGPVWRWIVLLGVLAGIVLRCPSLLTEPRVWAEEGQYLSHAWAHPWYETMVAPLQDYYVLFCNLTSTLAADAVPLRLAPHVLTYSALLIHLLPHVFVLWGRSVFFDSVASKLFACSVILLTSVGETWLNTINTHFYFCLLTALVLVEDPARLDSRLARGVRRFLVGFSGLCGVLSCLLFPAFAYRWWKTRNRDVLIYASILATATGLQILAALFRASEVGLTERFEAVSYWFFARNLLTYSFLGPVFGHFGPTAVYRDLLEQRQLLWIAITGVVLAVYGVFLLRLLLRSWRSIDGQVAIVGFFALVIPSNLLSMKMLGGPRYAFVSGVLLLFLIFREARSSEPGWMRLLARIFAVVALATAAAEFTDRVAEHVDGAWPRWSDELVKWEGDPSYRPAIWPRVESPDWRVELVPRR